MTDDGKPNNICKKIFSSVLFNLSEKYMAESYVARAVAVNFDRLPEDVKNLLDNLQGPLQGVIKVSLMKDKIRTIRLISNVRTKIDMGFALKILNELSKDKDEKVRAEAEALKSTHPFNSP